jgi:hypothetical protein
MSIVGFSVALRLRHPHIDPAELTRHLGIEPQHAWRAGEQRRLESGEPGQGVYRETYWVGLLPSVPLAVGDMIAMRRGPLPARVADRVSALAATPQSDLFFTLLKMKRAATFWKTFGDEGGSVECLLQIHRPERFNFEMSQALLTLLVAMRVTLSIEVESPQRAGAAAA